MTALSCDSPVHTFAPFVDPVAMGTAWRRHLPDLLGEQFEFTACKVQYARCRTYLDPASWHRSVLRVCYEFDLNSPAVSHKPMLYGRAYQQGRSQQEFDALKGLAGAQLVPELDMIVWRFPYDPLLPQLLELLDVTRAALHFPYADLPFAADAIADIAIEVVRYRPEQRCILRYSISYGPQRDNFVLYAKVFADDKGEQVFTRIRLCHATASALGVRIARPLGYGAAMRAVWQEELRGRSPVVMIDAGDGEMQMTAIGRCLARLHAADLPVQKSETRERRLLEACKKMRKLAQLTPLLAVNLVAIAARAQSDLLLLPPATRAVIHGDVHFGQFLVTDEGALALFDFDEWALGDPAQDLADLIVDPHLSKFERNTAETNRVLPPGLSSVLLASYRAHAAWSVTDATIIWHARIQLVNKAYRSAIQLEPCWQEKVAALVALVLGEFELGRQPGTQLEEEMAL